MCRLSREPAIRLNPLAILLVSVAAPEALDLRDIVDIRDRTFVTSLFKSDRSGDPFSEQKSSAKKKRAMAARF